MSPRGADSGVLSRPGIPSAPPAPPYPLGSGANGTASASYWLRALLLSRARTPVSHRIHPPPAGAGRRAGRGCPDLPSPAPPPTPGAQPSPPLPRERRASPRRALPGPRAVGGGHVGGSPGPPAENPGPRGRACLRGSGRDWEAQGGPARRPQPREAQPQARLPPEGGELSPKFQGFVSGRMVMTIKEEGSPVEKMTSRKGDDFHFGQTNARIGWLSPGRKNQKNRRNVMAKFPQSEMLHGKFQK
ncbi:basic salivary proline-rich protein 1-like [Mustela nigripes]|uniref:basic salivary proline-rich protein 1-like n=1 Tax=Mustela nigripes TaxID=77151 RepID=UPI0028154AA7|nr:basic salivary proline-rich protein 1-like [Mustela nigripes]